MPTGYTAGVADGTITDFHEYAIRCARQFGACITLKDEPMSGEIPEFKASTWNSERLAEATRDLSEFQQATDKQLRSMHKKAERERIAAARKYADGVKQTRERYEAMLAKAREFKAPTPDHEGYAKFLVSQLEESIRFDCADYWQERLKAVPFEEWKATKLKELERSIAYHRKEEEEELKRTNERNEWVRQLKDALAAATA